MTYSLIGIGVVSLVLFGIIEPRIKDPMVQLRLFQKRIFLLANLSGLLNGIARGAVLFLLIFFLQGPYGQDPLSAGLLLIPFGLAFMIIGPISGRISDSIGSRILAPVGLGISSLGLLGLATIYAVNSLLAACPVYGSYGWRFWAFCFTQYECHHEFC